MIQPAPINRLSGGNYLVDKDRFIETILKLRRCDWPITRTAFEVMEAYADMCFASEAGFVRNLDFKASLAIPAVEFVRIMMTVVPGYNEFYGAFTCSEMVGMFPETARYRIAREGSVCIYVENHGKDPTHLDVIRDHLQADECDLQEDGSIRFWWD